MMISFVMISLIALKIRSHKINKHLMKSKYNKEETCGKISVIQELRVIKRQINVGYPHQKLGHHLAKINITVF